MIRLALRRGQFTAIRNLTATPKLLGAVHDDTAVPDDCAAWVHQLSLLRGVPFNYLVPDAAMLPRESIRFFQVDPNWVNALIEGACSVGRASSADLAHDAALSASLYAAAKPPTGPVTGFLLRSAVVEGWPNLEVSAFADAAEQQPIAGAAVLRFEILAPSLLLFMVAGAIHHLTIHEPPEGLHFGVDLASATKELRYVTVPPGAQVASGDPAKPGDLIPGVSAAVTYRDGKNGRVVQTDRLAADAKAKLAQANANTGSDGKPRQFTAAEFTVQLVEGAQSVRFNSARAG
jgi:hypothetical protein